MRDSPTLRLPDLLQTSRRLLMRTAMTRRGCRLGAKGRPRFDVYTPAVGSLPRFRITGCGSLPSAVLVSTATSSVIRSLDPSRATRTCTVVPAGSVPYPPGLRTATCRTRLPPESRVTKPNFFSNLNHVTRPVASISNTGQRLRRAPWPQAICAARRCQ